MVRGLLPYPGYSLRQAPFEVQVAEPLEHGPLGLRGAGPVNRFHQQGIGVAARYQILDEPYDPHLILRWDASGALEILLQ